MMCNMYDFEVLTLAALTFRRFGPTCKEPSKCNFIFDSRWRQHPGIICSSGNVRRCPTVSRPGCVRVLWLHSNQCEIHMWDAGQLQGQNIAPDYRQFLWNVIQYCRPRWYSGLTAGRRRAAICHSVTDTCHSSHMFYIWLYQWGCVLQVQIEDLTDYQDGINVMFSLNCNIHYCII